MSVIARPEIPLMTENLPTGKRTLTFFRLFARARGSRASARPRLTMRRLSAVGWQSGVHAGSDQSATRSSCSISLEAFPAATSSPPCIARTGRDR